MFARKQDSDLCTDICQWVPLSFLGNALFRTENNNPKVADGKQTDEEIDCDKMWLWSASYNSQTISSHLFH